MIMVYSELHISRIIGSKSYKAIILIAVFLLFANLASGTTVTVESIPPTHWLRLFSSNTTGVNVTGLAYGDDKVYVLFREDSDVNKFHLVALNSGNGTIYSPDEYNSHYYYSYGLGDANTIVYNEYNDLLYVGTDTGFIVVIDPATMHPKYAVRIWHPNGEIRHLSVGENGYIGAAIKTSSGVYASIMNPVGLYSIHTLGFNSTDIYCTRYIGGDTVISYVVDPEGHPSIYVVNLTDSSKTLGIRMLSGGGNNNNATTPSVQYDGDTKSVLVSTITQSSGVFSTYVYNFSLNGSTFKARKVSSSNTNIEIVYANAFGNGKIYMTGTIRKNNTKSDLLYMELDINNNAYKAWYIGGENTEQSISSSQTMYGDEYLFVAATTDSYGFNNTRNSSFVALVSPQLLGGEEYNWNVTPPDTNSGVYVTSQELDVTGQEAGIIGSVDYSLGSTCRCWRPICYKGENIETYNADTDTEPVPVPESNMVVAASIAGLFAVAVLYMRKSRS